MCLSVKKKKKQKQTVTHALMFSEALLDAVTPLLQRLRVFAVIPPQPPHHHKKKKKKKKTRRAINPFMSKIALSLYR